MAIFSGKSQMFDDTDKIIDDLIDGWSNDSSIPRVGILFCDSRIDYTVVNRTLYERLGFTIIGGTSLTMPMTESTNEISATFVVFEKEGMSCVSCVSEPLSQIESFESESIKAVYERCLETMGETPKMLLPLLPLSPGVPADPHMNALFSICGNIPVFGGVTTNDLVSTTAAVFLNGESYTDRMVLTALGGTIRPVFSMGSQLSVIKETPSLVTESSGVEVQKVGDQSFCDYMRSQGITPEDRINGVDALVQYGPLPCRLQDKLEDDDGIPEIRCISRTNVSEGSAIFSSEIPVGTAVNMGLILKDDVAQSLEKSFNEIKKSVQTNEQDGYEYSLLLSFPCVARYFAMLGGENVETIKFKTLIDSHITVSGFYAFLEVCPSHNAEGRMQNRSNNASIVLCAI